MRDAYLISMFMKTTIVLAAGLLLLRSLQRQSAATLHLICLMALMSAAAVPMLALWSPHWSYFMTIPAELGDGPGSRRIVFGHWPALLTALWAVGAVIFAVRSAGGWFVLRHARRRSSRFMTGEAAEVRIGNVSMPFTCGLLRPLIILPQTARQWDGGRLQVVLLHESAHVQRRDCLAKYVAHAARTVLWWNPLAWRMASRMEQEQEQACDEAVLSAGVAPETYAKALLDSARECSNPLLLWCAMSNSSALRGRLEHLFAWRPESARATRKAALAIPLLLALMCGVSCAGKRVSPSQIAPGVSTVPQARQRIR